MGSHNYVITYLMGSHNYVITYLMGSHNYVIALNIALFVCLLRPQVSTEQHYGTTLKTDNTDISKYMISKRSEMVPWPDLDCSH